MSAAAIDLEGVSKRFRRGELHDSLRDLLPSLGRRFLWKPPADERESREFWALRDVSFSVNHGEAFAIVGGNGAGKSTMLKLLSGIMRPTRGTVRISGRLSALIEVSAGFHQDLTGRENIFLNGAILGMSRAEISRRFDEIVEFSGLEAFLDTPVKRYSSGMFARLGFAVAAHVDAEILLVDEVLSVGDYLFQRKCVQRMNEVLSSGATVVFVSHNLRAVADLCQRGLLLERGRVTELGTAAKVIRTYLERGRTARVDVDERPISITKVSVGTEAGDPVMEIESGERVRIVVEARARSPHHDISVVVQVVDEQQYPVFDTCSQRLGAGPLTIDADGVLNCVFEIDLSLAEGTYHVNAFLHRYVTDIAFDRWEMAATFFVKSTPKVRGVMNLNPTLIACETGVISPTATGPREGDR